MDRVTLKNFRCFREEQTARLAPLTLLVGENSAGKTSFLALLRALWEIAYNLQIPDFKEAPMTWAALKKSCTAGVDGRILLKLDSLFVLAGLPAASLNAMNSHLRKAVQHRFQCEGTEPPEMLG